MKQLLIFIFTFTLLLSANKTMAQTTNDCGQFSYTEDFEKILNEKKSEKIINDNLKCFGDKLINCSPGKLKIIRKNNPFYYSIEGNSTSSCRIKFEYGNKNEYASSSESIKYANKSVSCPASFNEISQDTMYPAALAIGNIESLPWLIMFSKECRGDLLNQVQNEKNALVNRPDYKYSIQIPIDKIIKNIQNTLTRNHLTAIKKACYSNKQKMECTIEFFSAKDLKKYFPIMSIKLISQSIITKEKKSKPEIIKSLKTKANSELEFWYNHGSKNETKIKLAGYDKSIKTNLFPGSIGATKGAYFIEVKDILNTDFKKESEKFLTDSKYKIANSFFTAILPILGNGLEYKETIEKN